MLRKVFWLSWFKRQVLKFWLRAGEKGPGTAAVKYPNGATPAEQQKALQLAEAMVNKIAIAVPDNIGLVEQLLTQARPQDPKVYEMLFTALQYAIARRVKGETLSSFGNEGGTGSKSMGDTHTETKEERSVSFCKMVERVINLQLIRPLVVWNYGPNAPLPVWTIEKNPQQDLKQRAEIDDTLQAMGLAIPKSYAQKQYGIPEPENEEDTLTRTATAPAPLQATGNQLTQTFADAELKREMADIDKLLVESLRAAQTIMRDRIANVLTEVRV
jgi:phage gp29-like protein